MEMIISSRLTPAFKVGDATVSLWPLDRAGVDGKPEWGWEIDIPEVGMFEGDDFRGWGNAGEMAAHLAGFLSHCGEAWAYQERTGREADGANLFPAQVARWAAENLDELSMLSEEG